MYVLFFFPPSILSFPIYFIFVLFWCTPSLSRCWSILFSRFYSPFEDAILNLFVHFLKYSNICEEVVLLFSALRKPYIGCIENYYSIIQWRIFLSTLPFSTFWRCNLFIRTLFHWKQDDYSVSWKKLIWMCSVNVDIMRI